MAGPPYDIPASQKVILGTNELIREHIAYELTHD